MVETFQSLPFFYKERKNGIIHMRNNIRIYEVKSEYIKYLNNYQKHIFTQAQEKDKRKYIGIVFEVKGIKYFAPLSSFKDKHKQMKEGVDFIKIKDYAVINLNNMIPVPDSQIVDFKEGYNEPNEGKGTFTQTNFYSLQKLPDSLTFLAKNFMTKEELGKVTVFKK